MRKTPLDAWIAGIIGAETLTRGGLSAWQIARTNEAVEYARSRSRFYRNLLGSREICLSGRDDLAGLPFTSAADIAARPMDFLSVSQERVSRIITLRSSGTTGEPKRIFFTEADQERTADFFAVGMSTLVGPGDRVLILFPCGQPGSVGELLCRALPRIGVRPIPHGPVGDPREALEAAVKSGATSLAGTAIQAHLLCGQWRSDCRETGHGGECHQGGHARPALMESFIRTALLSADYVPDAVVRELREIWGCAVYGHYGMTEMGLGGGVECEAREGYHMREGDMLIEIIDPVTGRPVPDGLPGEVVITTLRNEAMPLIRYRTGDISRFIPGPCPCGSSLPRLEKLRGRAGGGILMEETAVVPPGGRAGVIDGRIEAAVGSRRLSIADLEEALLPVPGLADFRASVERSAGKNGSPVKLTVTIRTFGAEGPGLRDNVLRALLGIPVIGEAAGSGDLEVSVQIGMTAAGGGIPAGGTGDASASGAAENASLPGAAGAAGTVKRRIGGGS